MSRLRDWRLMILLIVDAILVNLSYIAAFYFKFINEIPETHIRNYISSSFFITIIYILSLFIFKLYKSLWTHAGIDEFLLCTGGCITGSVLSMLYGITISPGIPQNVSILGGILSFILIVGFRISFRVYRRSAFWFNKHNKENYKKVIIIGAGSAGTITINEMKKHPEMQYMPVGLIDDNKYKIGKTISGIKILGDRTKIKEIVKGKKVEEIIIAIPSLKEESKAELVKICKETGCKTKILPGIYDLINGNVTLHQIRDVNAEDLLCREPIILDYEEIWHYLEGKTILVTGGGGSIGSELCRQISRFNPKALLVLDIYENGAYDLYNELNLKFSKLNIKVLIASVTDRKILEKIFYEYKPEVVFHAAAHKHVPLMEDNPAQAIKNNVFGTLNVVECADKYCVKKFVMISTDKAVNPTNIMGASKRICEMIIQGMEKQSETEFVAVRFGNVLGSSGSVVPLFKRQIACGGPVTVTSEHITRYFMTIPEAAQLVLQASALAHGGEIFVLDMGNPVKIYDLACDLIKLSGLAPHKDIEVRITGLRPGEKLYEELLMAEEGLNKTKHKKIFIGKPISTDLNVLKRSFDELKFIIEVGNREELIRKIKEIVPTYRRINGFSDQECDEANIALIGEGLLVNSASAV